MFRPISTTLHEKIPKARRQAEGIYFTPAAARARLFALLPPTEPQRILEPSFGSGEFIVDLLDRYPSARVVGVEKNKELAFAAMRELKTRPNLCLSNGDFLEFHGPQKFDLIVGNPPYFVTTEKEPAAFWGRGNIFVLFLYKCLTEHINPDGILAFVLPRSFYNCAYYEPCREFMRLNTEILAVDNLEDPEFHDTLQDTFVLVLRNRKPKDPVGPYFLRFGNTTVISPFYQAIRELTATSSTIAEQGCAVKTGDVVWNQHKEKLVATGGTLLIFANNIRNGTLVFGDPGKGKKQQIKGFGREPVTGPAIVITRGYGNTAYTLNFAMVPDGTIFYGENHVNVITGPAAALSVIHTSLQDARTTAFLKMFVGNGALSKTELEQILPIWV